MEMYGLSMPTILDFQIQSLSAETYSLVVCERPYAQPFSSHSLVSATFSHRVDFLTDFNVDRLNASTKDAAERFAELQKLGRELYQKLFSPAVEQVWHEYKQRSEFLILCLRFADGATKLEALPWETLHDDTEFIAAGAKTTLTRLPLGVAPPSELPPIPRPLKLFGFFASPLDLGDHERLSAEREQEILLEAINDPAGQGRISADFEDEAKLEILARSLRDGYHILHFTGHGISPRDGGGLLLEDAHGKKLPASIAEVMQAVKSGVDKLRLAVISGCQTARTLHTGAYSDLARELLRQHVPAVIAMQFSITDEGGLKLAEVLYKEIAKGVELERAVHAARRVLLEDERFFINNDALAIVLLAADGACLQTTEAEVAPPQDEPSATYVGDRLDPLAHGFYGRRREFRKIRDALMHQGQRAVIIHGIGGIGKTALLTHAINRLHPRFKDVVSFDSRRAALAPETILLELHCYFAAQGIPQLQSLIGQNVPPGTLADEIAQMLMQWPLLIVFDNFETQLDEKREIANVDLRVFLTSLVRAMVTGSRFLFTTRYLFDLDSELLGNLQELPLGDLSRHEALMLMQKLPNLAQAAHPDKLAVLEKFGGHPYALVTLDRHCSHQPLDQALQDARSLESELREFLAIELNYLRLSEQARELLNRLAAFHIAIPFAAAEWVISESVPLTLESILAMRDELPEELKALDDDSLKQKLGQIPLLVGREVRDVDSPVQELIDWGLLTPQVENGELQSLIVHSLVRDFCRNQQLGEIWNERLRDAAKFFTNQTLFIDEKNKSSTAVWSEMEAFNLLIEAGDFEIAAYTLSGVTRILNRWGFGCFVAEQGRRLSGKLAGKELAITLHNYAVTMQTRGEYEAALEIYRRVLAIDEDLDNRDGVARVLHQVGLIHQARGEYDAALEQYQRSLEIAEQIGGRPGLEISGDNVGGIGRINQARGEYEAAMERYQRSLEIAKELDDHDGIANSLSQIGTIYQDCGEYLAALKHYQESLEIVEKIGDRAGEARERHMIGMVQVARGEYGAALEMYRHSLAIYEELSNKEGISSLLHEIGNLHLRRGEYQAASEHYQWSLAIDEELGDHYGMATSLHSIGTIHQACGEYAAALELYHKSLVISEELGDRKGIARALNNIGTIHQNRGEYAAALEFYHKSLAVSEELGDRVSAVGSLNNIGTIHEAHGEYAAALKLYQRVLAIEEEMGDRHGVAGSLRNIGIILQNRGEYAEALDMYQRSLAMAEELGDRVNAAKSLYQMGIIHFLREEYVVALGLYQRSLAMAEELGDRDGMANSMLTIGMIHRARGEYEEALGLYQQSLAIGEELGDRASVAISQYQIGVLFTKTELYAEAFPLLLNALATVLELQSPNEEIVVDTLKELRAEWGMVNFDAKWQEATNEDVPEWLTNESDATAL
jgi:tetratricopeptide (TPR) repeat protein/CHAT domain-containing protein